MGAILSALKEYRDTMHRPDHEGNFGLSAQGKRYREQGYRLLRTPRQVAGLSIDIPSNAIEWELVEAGVIGPFQSERLLYVVKIEEN